MEHRFRNTDSYAEIKNFVDLSTPSQTLVWQTFKNKRNVFSCFRVTLKEKAQLIEFSLKKYDNSLLVNEIIYIKLSNNHTLFKGEVISLEGDILKVFIPEEVKTIENRVNPRMAFLPKENRKISLEVAKEITSVQAYKMHFVVLDISKDGLSIIVSENNINLIQNSEKHLLTELKGIELPSSVLLDLRYTQKYRYRLHGKVVNANRVGFKFLNPIDQAYLDRFVG